MTRIGPASLITGVGGVSVDGPIAIESSREIEAGGAAEEEACPGPGPEAVEVETTRSLLDDDKGSVDCAEPDIAALDDCSGLVFSLLVSDILREEGKVESKGEDVGIETSLRRPCEPAPAVLFEASRSLISMGIVD
jgi:hypothetical protein